MPSVILFGGYGVFGSLIARELVSRGISVTIAGRNNSKAEALALQLGEKARGLEADATQLESCRRALAGHRLAVHCAGPFSEKNLALLQACLETGCHYVDIADDRGYLARVRALQGEFSAKQLSAVYGCSSLPGISGALAETAIAETQAAPAAIRVLLFIGNRNPKGPAALESVLKIAGTQIPAPQGWLRGLGDLEAVQLPAPFGRRWALNFESAEYDMFPDLFGCGSVTVKVSFELGIANRLFAMLGHARRSMNSLLRGPLLILGNSISAWGSSGGAVQVQVSGEKKQCSMTLLNLEAGQRMAILPAVFSVQRILRGKAPTGALPVFECLGSSKLLEGLLREGCRIEKSFAG